MKYTIIIPSRLHSTRLEKKAIAEIGGKPLIIQVALAAKKTNARVVVATDHDVIADICAKHQIEFCMTNENHQSGTDRLAQAVQILGLSDDEVVVNVQGDEPFMSPEIIDSVAQVLLQNKELRMSTAAHPIQSAQEVINPNIVKVVCNTYGKALYFSRAPIPWQRDAWQATNLDKAQSIPEKGIEDMWRHIGVYGFRVEFLKHYPSLPPTFLEKAEMLEQLRALYNGIDIHVVETNIVPEPGIDTPEDLLRARNKWNELYPKE